MCVCTHAILLKTKVQCKLSLINYSVFLKVKKKKYCLLKMMAEKYRKITYIENEV